MREPVRAGEIHARVTSAYEAQRGGGEGGGPCISAKKLVGGQTGSKRKTFFSSVESRFVRRRWRSKFGKTKSMMNFRKAHRPRRSCCKGHKSEFGAGGGLPRARIRCRVDSATAIIRFPAPDWCGFNMEIQFLRGPRGNAVQFWWPWRFWRTARGGQARPEVGSGSQVERISGCWQGIAHVVRLWINQGPDQGGQTDSRLPRGFGSWKAFRKHPLATNHADEGAEKCFFSGRGCHVLPQQQSCTCLHAL